MSSMFVVSRLQQPKFYQKNLVAFAWVRAHPLHAQSLTPPNRTPPPPPRGWQPSCGKRAPWCRRQRVCLRRSLVTSRPMAVAPRAVSTSSGNTRTTATDLSSPWYLRLNANLYCLHGLEVLRTQEIKSSDVPEVLHDAVIKHVEDLQCSIFWKLGSANFPKF